MCVTIETPLTVKKLFLFLRNNYIFLHFNYRFTKKIIIKREIAKYKRKSLYTNDYIYIYINLRKAATKSAQIAKFLIER